MSGPTSVHAAFHVEITARDLARFEFLPASRAVGKAAGGA